MSESHWDIIELAFKALGWNMTPVHIARQELEVVVEAARQVVEDFDIVAGPIVDALHAYDDQGCDTNPITDWKHE